jgi:hypothetical protein
MKFGSSVNFLDFSFKGEYLSICHDDNNLTILDLKNFQIKKNIQFKSFVYTLRYSPNINDFIFGINGYII